MKKNIKKSAAAIKKEVFQKFRQKPVRLVISVFVLIISTLLIYGVANFYLHKDKTYSNLYLSQNQAGGLSEEELVRRINYLFSQTQIELNYSGQKQIKTASELGIVANEASLKAFVAHKSFRDALRPWFIKSNKVLDLSIDNSKMEQSLKKIQSKDFKPASNAGFSVKNDKLIIEKQKDGFGLDARKIGNEITESLSFNLAPLSKDLEVAVIEAAISEQDIRSLSEQINLKLDQEYALIWNGSGVIASKKDIAEWLYAAKQKNGAVELKIDSNKIKQYVEAAAGRFSIEPVNEVTSVYKSGKNPAITTEGKKGRIVTNIDSVAEEMQNKLTSNESYKGEFITAEADFQKVRTAVDDTLRTATYTYDVAVWGSVKSDLASFKALAAQTLADSRGWSSGGVTFREVASGGNFTLVLAEPSRVASASSICSSLYSCRVGRNVIINDDRWRLATPSWNNAGGQLRDYRHMVINHETGHWLGFSHRYCSGAGQPAPVMQQQSISLQGCKFNPWPVAAEIASL